MMNRAIVKGAAGANESSRGRLTLANTSELQSGRNSELLLFLNSRICLLYLFTYLFESFV